MESRRPGSETYASHRHPTGATRPSGQAQEPASASPIFSPDRIDGEIDLIVGDGWHDRRVREVEVVEAMHPPTGTDNGERISCRSESARADRVVVGRQVGPGPIAQGGCPHRST